MVLRNADVPVNRNVIEFKSPHTFIEYCRMKLAKKEEENKAKAKKTAPAKEPEKPAEPEKQLTLADVRAVLAEKSRAGFTEEVKALIAKHGADRLSEVPETEYAALLADAEVLG